MKQVIYGESKEDLASKLTKIITKEMQSIIQNKEYLTLGLCGGNSVNELFKAMLNEKLIPWDKTHLFWVDERLDGKDSYSNFSLAKELLLTPLLKNKKISESQIHKFKEENYEKELKKYGNSFDIAILSAGDDGHIASLFPDHKALEDKKNGFIIIEDSPKKPFRRGTATIPLLENTKISILLFYGKQKQIAWKKFNEKSVKIKNCPAKVTLHNKTTYLAVSI